MTYISKKAFWNEAKVKNLLTVSDQAVYDCLIAVYNNQTASEQRTLSTVVDNGKGFTGADAEFGSSLAQQVLAGRTLSRVARTPGKQPQIHWARKLALKYWSQFAEALNAEREAQGLPAQQPKPEKGTDTQVEPDRFTWEPGDLVPVKADGDRYDTYRDPLFDGFDLDDDGGVPDAPEPEAKRVELFDGDEPAEYRNLPDLFKTDYEAALQSREWLDFLRAVQTEADAWYVLALVSTPQPGTVAPPAGTVPALAAAYRVAEQERQRIAKAVGFDGLAKASESAAGRWHEKWGTQGGENWLKSEDFTLWHEDYLARHQFQGVK